MNSDFNLFEYTSKGIENVVNGVIKASFRNPKEAAFILKYSLASKEAKKKRELLKENGENIPAFLIASITSSCNLFCKGCYARANNTCGEEVHKKPLSVERWSGIFKEAKDLGIPFMLIIGGEPLMRRDVLEKAAEEKDILFPIFTNGTMLKDEYIKLFHKNRNLIPMLSIEGNEGQTDNRRGKGTFELLMNVMDKLNEKGILYGASITVTTENIKTVTSIEFFHKLYKKGCHSLIFVEYVPVSEDTKYLAPADAEREILESQQQKLRELYEDAVFISFPGDEKYSGGCLAAGRGFFHISVDGSAEPCPFSPHSDTSLNNCTLREAINSPLFRKLNETGMLMGEHMGGCLLYEKENEVKRLLIK